MTTIFIKDAAITSIGPDRSRNIVLSSSHFSLAWSIRDRQAGGVATGPIWHAGLYF